MKYLAQAISQKCLTAAHPLEIAEGIRIVLVRISLWSN